MNIADLNTRFVLAEENLPVRQLGEMLARLPEAARREWYAVVRLSTPGRQVVPQAGGGFEEISTPPPGYAAFLPLTDLGAAFSQQGSALLDQPLSAVPGLLEPALAMESQLMGVGRARREWLPRSPRYIAVILEAGQIIGLLVSPTRAGGFGGFPTSLVGRERRTQPMTRDCLRYRCPVDGGLYDFADLIDLETNRLVCPQGHIIQE